MCVCVMEYYSAIKKNEIIPFAAIWMDLEMIILSEISLKEKDKCHMKLLIRAQGVQKLFGVPRGLGL